jgi:hypothetical protein
MKWFRSNIKHGSRLALFALALQFVLSFGHFHSAARAAPAIQSGLSYVLTTADGPSQQPDSDRQPNDPCAICAVVALASTVLFATPPSLPLPQAVDHSYLTADARFIDLNSASPAFQPRAPPTS